MSSQRLLVTVECETGRREVALPGDIPIARLVPQLIDLRGGATGPGADASRLADVIAAPRLARCVTIAVVSPKGGVGKPTTAALLGSLFAMIRSDRVVAVDSNPDHGTLGRSLTAEHAVFVDDLLEVI